MDGKYHPLRKGQNLDRIIVGADHSGAGLGEQQSRLDADPRLAVEIGGPSGLVGLVPARAQKDGIARFHIDARVTAGISDEIRSNREPVGEGCSGACGSARCSAWG